MAKPSVSRAARNVKMTSSLPEHVKRALSRDAAAARQRAVLHGKPFPIQTSLTGAITFVRFGKKSETTSK